MARSGFTDIMNDEQRHFLGLCSQVPARLSVEQTAWILNVPEHDVPVLVAAKVLRPLGNPPKNGVKYFAAMDILELCKDRAWLAKATNVIHQHWAKKGGGRKARRMMTENGEVDQRSISAQLALR